MTMYWTEIWREINALTDAPCSVAAQHEARNIAGRIGVNGAFIAADHIDRSCVYCQDADVVLFGECELAPWHTFANKLRGSWETYG